MTTSPKVRMNLFFLSTDNASGAAEIVFQYGVGGNFTPLVGDWDNL